MSSEVFSSLDTYVRTLLYKWARWRHRNKPRRWVVTRYFGKFNKFRNDHWVFGDRDSGAYLVKFSWTGIERHVPVKGAASPDDPALASYWAKRRTKVKPSLDRYTLRLLSRQAGLCPLCGDHLLSGYLTRNERPGPPHGDQIRLVHPSCQRRLDGPPRVSWRL